LVTKGRAERYTGLVRSRVMRLLEDCRWRFPVDVQPDSFVAWRSSQNGPAPKTLNEYLNAISGLMNWMEAQGRIPANPLRRVQHIDVRGKQQERCSFSPEQFANLLTVAGKRRIIYQTAAYTGLRAGELSQLVRADLHLDGPTPFIKARSSTTKNSEDAFIPLHPGLAEALSEHCGSEMPPDAPVFFMTIHPERPLYRDMEKAGIPRKDPLGRRRDFHSFRGTFATALAANGTAPRVTQELMRHQDARLTAKVYTDVFELPVLQAVRGLPWVAGSNHPQIAPQKSGNSGLELSQSDSGDSPVEGIQVVDEKSDMRDLSQPDKDCQMVEVAGIEPASLWPSGPASTGIGSISSRMLQAMNPAKHHPYPRVEDTV